MKYGFNSLTDVITGSMILIIDILTASGILEGILALLAYYKVVKADGGTYRFTNAMVSSIFYSLPIIVGFTATRGLGADLIIVAITGGVLCFLSLVAVPDSKGGGCHVATTLGDTTSNADFFGIPMALPTRKEGVAYTSAIPPIIIATWLASKMGPWLERWTPAVIHSMFAPLTGIFAVSTLVLVVFGPPVMFLSSPITNGVDSVVDFNYVPAGPMIDGLYQTFVIFGSHWVVIPIIASQLVTYYGNNPSEVDTIISVIMIAQRAGVLVIWVKSKNSRIKQIARSATISTICGVTEPAMHGLNLRYGRAFITTSISEAIGGLVTGLLNVNMWGSTGMLVGFTPFISKQTGEIDSSFTGFWITSFVAIIAAFAYTYLFGSKDSDLETERKMEEVRFGRRESVAK